MDWYIKLYGGRYKEERVYPKDLHIICPNIYICPYIFCSAFCPLWQRRSWKVGVAQQISSSVSEGGRKNLFYVYPVD